MADQDSIAAEIEELNDKYETLEAAVPEGPESGPSLTALNEEYEKEFAEIGPGDQPNGAEPSLSAEEREPNLVPEGIHPAKENPTGYLLTNYWANTSVSDGALFIAGASLEEDTSVGGVYAVTADGEAFIPSPSKSGPLTIESVSGTILTLTTEGGDSLHFDYASMEFTSP